VLRWGKRRHVESLALEADGEGVQDSGLKPGAGPTFEYVVLETRSPGGFGAVARTGPEGSSLRFLPDVDWIEQDPELSPAVKRGGLAA
jgi:hypothetical protein